MTMKNSSYSEEDIVDEERIPEDDPLEPPVDDLDITDITVEGTVVWARLMFELNFKQ